MTNETARAIRRAAFLAFAAIAAGLPAPAVSQAQAQAEDAAAEAPLGEARAEPSKAPVRFRGEELFHVRAPIGDLTLEARAAAIEQRLLAIAAGPTDAVERIAVVPKAGSTDVMVDEKLVTSVLDADALPTGRTRDQVAADYSRVVQRALQREFGSRSLKGLALGSAQALAAVAGFALLLSGIRRGERRASTAVLELAGTRIPDLRLRDVTLLTAERFAAMLRSVVRLASFVLIAILLYLALQLFLGAFAWTRGLADRLLDFGRGIVSWIGGGIWEYLPNVFYIAAIAYATRLVLRGQRFLFRELDRGALTLPGFHRDWATPTYKILRGITFAFALVVVFPYLPGSGSPAFQGVSVFLGVLLSLGSGSAIANVVAGVVLTYMRPFRVGDRVKIADTVGDVIEVTLLVVRVRTIKNVDITIPNSMVLGNHIINYSSVAAEEGLILNTEVTIGYDVPWRQVHELLLASARDVDGIRKEPAPFILQTKLNDFYVHYELNAYTDRPNRMAVLYARLHERIQDRFAEAGVEIMSPHYLAARDGNTITLPSDQLPPGYHAPAFRVQSVAKKADAP